MRFIGRCAVVLLLNGASVTAAGQQPGALDSGEVVRLHEVGGSRLTVRLLAPIDADWQTVRFCRARAAVCEVGTLNEPQERRRQDVTTIDVRRGRRTAHGAVVGGLIGAVWGVLAMGAAARSESPRARPMLAVPLGAALGAGVGALIGAVSHRWVPDPELVR